MGCAVAPGDVMQEEDGFDVWPENWHSITAFLACETQWRLALGMAGALWQGLDYGGVDTVLRRHALPDGIFGDLQIMERAALDILNGSANG